jgi:hypothetical protein
LCPLRRGIGRDARQAHALREETYERCPGGGAVHMLNPVDEPELESAWFQPEMCCYPGFQSLFAFQMHLVPPLRRGRFLAVGGRRGEQGARAPAAGPRGGALLVQVESS